MNFKGLCNNRIVKAVITVILCISVFAVSFVLSGIDLSTSALFGNSFDKNSDFVRIIDVGQGDSILIYSNGYSALIDTGLSDAASDVCTALESCGIKTLDVLLITHLDSDHIGAAAGVTEIYGVKNLIMPEISSESEGLSTAQLVINRVVEADGNIYTAVQGMNFEIGEFELTVLAAFPEMADENNRSVITVAEIEDLKFLLTGDMEAKAEKALLGENLDLKCDVLKVGHHGSSTSSNMDLLKAVMPRYAAISVGQNNDFGHPHNEVISDLQYIGAEIYRTDTDGDITFYIENKRIVPKTEK
ncbi:MAG: MBL fold metallo-hydrolase [Ruminococcaceae bacterium]|nr:MBL fold metallo-hydrolase [Oscillospiraceae bacterium]